MTKIFLNIEETLTVTGGTAATGNDKIIDLSEIAMIERLNSSTYKLSLKSGRETNVNATMIKGIADAFLGQAEKVIDIKG